MNYQEASAGRNYVERTRQEVDALLIGELGFHEISLPGVREVVYERQIVSKKGVRHPYSVRVYSSVLSTTGCTRDVGEDAIKVVLIPDGGYPTKVLGEGRNSKAGKRINRTKGAMKNLRTRVVQYFELVILNRCTGCGSLMAVRNGKHGRFLGCRNYPECNGTRPIPDGF